MSTEVRLDFSTDDAIRKLDALEQRMEALVRKAAEVRFGGDAQPGSPTAPGGGGSGASVNMAPALEDKLDRLLDVLAQQGGVSGGERHAEAARRAASEDTRQAREQARRDAAESQLAAMNARSMGGAILGGLGAFGGGNLLGGISQMGGALIGGTVGGVTGGVLGQAFQLALNTAGNTARAAVGADKELAALLRTEHGTIGAEVSRGDFERALRDFIANTGLSADDYVSTRRRSQRASGLRDPGDATEAALLEMIGISAEQTGAFRGASRRVGLEEGSTTTIRDLAGLGQSLGLAADAMFGLVATQREQILRAGGADSAAASSDFLRRLYADPAARMTGAGAAEAAIGLQSNNVGLSRRLLSPAAEMADTLDEMAAYQAALASGATGFFGVQEAAADFALNESGESKASRYRGLMGADAARVMLRGRVPTSRAAAQAVVDAAGADRAPVDVQAQGITPAALTAAYVEAFRIVNREQGRKLEATGLDPEGIRTYETTTGAVERALMAFGRFTLGLF